MRVLFQAHNDLRKAIVRGLPQCADGTASPPAAKAAISIRLAPEQIAAAKKIAAAKSVGYQTQLRMWIAEGIQREAKRS
jgi:hypothetical protein